MICAGLSMLVTRERKSIVAFKIMSVPGTEKELLPLPWESMESKLAGILFIVQRAWCTVTLVLEVYE